MEAYSYLSKMYDLLMEDVNYKEWFHYIEGFIKSYGNGGGKVLELACGTGNMTELLLDNGYKVVALDISEEMLMVAQGKTKKHSGQIRYVCGDMCHFKMEDRFDHVVALCDGYNYILEEEDLTKSFRAVHQHLKSDGLFVFDISSKYKLSTILGNNTYAENDDSCSYIWENFYDEVNDVLDFDFTLFVEEGRHYKKYFETHRQKAHETQEIIGLLENIGFEVLLVSDDFTDQPWHSKSERIHFVCKKSGRN